MSSEQLNDSINKQNLTWDELDKQQAALNDIYKQKRERTDLLKGQISSFEYGSIPTYLVIFTSVIGVSGIIFLVMGLFLFPDPSGGISPNVVIACLGLLVSLIGIIIWVTWRLRCSINKKELKKLESEADEIKKQIASYEEKKKELNH